MMTPRAIEESLQAQEECLPPRGSEAVVSTNHRLGRIASILGQILNWIIAGFFP